jgi:MerR family redox-sensitive transcriptional activator SoxR
MTVAQRIRQLEALQSSLDGCIGCGCLSLGKCTLFNPGDEAASEGQGSRWLRKVDAIAFKP